MKLALFDIDGTLLWTDGAGRRAIHRALLAEFGAVGTADYWFDGKTDRQIVRDLMRGVGYGDDAIDARMESTLRRYVTHLGEELADPAHTARVLDGVPELLDALERRDDVVLGLLTGNLAEGADAKLRAVGIEPARFVVGAYGSDHEVRSELPAIARARATAQLGFEIACERLFVIGDTPADIACGRGIGARAIAVATGRYGLAELALHSPAHVFPDLRDTAAIVRAITDG